MLFVLTSIAPWNTHWTGAPVSDLILTHPGRRAFTPHWSREIQEAETWRLAPGPRQIGKTNALGHVIEDFIQSGVPPRHIAYIPMEQRSVQTSIGDQGWESIVQALSDLHTPTPQQPLYLLLDEVQTVPTWPERLVALYNRHRRDVRLIATGSSAIRLKDLKNADFPGRIHALPVYPMKFREILEHHPERPLDALPHGDLRARIEAVRAALADGDWERFTDVVIRFSTKVQGASGLQGQIQSLLDQYLIWGGYPRLRPGSGVSHTERMQLLEQYWTSILAKDLLPRGRARKVEPLSWLFERLALQSPSSWDPIKLHNELGVDATTLRSWAELLVDAMLIQPLPRLTQGLRPSPKADRLVLLDPAWRTYASKITDPVQLQTEGIHGRMAEGVLTDHMRRLVFNVQGTTKTRIGYLSGPEVDLVVPIGPLTILMESKFRTQTTHARKNLAPHLDGQPERRGVVVTRDHLDYDEDDILWCPLATLLLLC